MATAGPDVMELITCPICKDIFTDPKSLKCRHTLCAECLDGLMESRRDTDRRNPRIKCPCCRELCTERDVRDDYRVNEMVAMFGAHVTLPDNHLCEFCEKNKLRWRCTECRSMICQDCKMVHEKVTMKGGSAQHEIQSVRELAEKMRAQLTDSKHKIDSVLATAQQDLHEIRHYREHLQTQRGQILAEIDRQEKIKVDGITSKFSELRQKVRSSVAEELTNTSYKLNHVQSAVTSAHQKFYILGDDDDGAPQSLTDIVVNYGMGEGELSLLSLNDQWHTPAPNLHISYTPPSVDRNIPQHELILDEQFETGSLKIQQNFEPISFDFKVLNFNDNFETRFKKEKEIELPSYCHGFESVDGQLWCPEFDKNRILVLEVGSGDVIKTITAAMLEHPTCVINTSSITGRMLIGCSYDAGLLEFDMDGNYKQILFKGSICSGALYNDTLYVLRNQHKGSNTSHVFICQHNGVEWNVTQNFELDYCRTSHNDTIAVTSQGLHITSWCNCNVWLYDFNGQFIRYAVDLPHTNPEPHPRMCQVDSNGHILLTESIHGKVYFLGDNNQWCTILLPEVPGPRHASLHNGGKSMWILELNGTKLNKYVDS